MSEPSLAVTATINLHGLRAGEHALVDPADPYIAELLSASFLIVRAGVEPGQPFSLPVADEVALEEPAPLNVSTDP